jgi:N-acetylneuraminic acid mutarotase
MSGQAVASVGANVYSFGGIVNNIAIANAYKYTPATNTWTPIASLPAPRGWFSAASDGTYVYLLGGVDQNFNTTATLWRYDPTSNTYNTSLPSYTIPTYFHASAYLNGKIYRIAGRAIGTDFHVEVYDIAANTWSMAANYPFANHSLMAAAIGSFIYAGGGNASPDKTYRYDPGTNTWDDAAIADLPAGRSAAASGAYNGTWLLAGGDVNFAISTSAISWDPATNTWNNLPNMVQARDYLAGATTGQSFYAVAGNSAPGTPTNDNQQYTETPCTTPTPTPTPIACFLFENFDNVTPPALPSGWTAGNVIDPDGILWQTSNSGNPSPPADSPPNAAWINDPDAVSDKHLDSPPITIDALENAALIFRNNYALQNSFDGGVLEVSIDGGPFQDILAAGGFFGQGGYNGTISTCCGNPLAGRQAWTGSSGGFIETDVALPFQGHTIVLRWRMASDSGVSGQGWRVDTVQIVCERPTPTATPTATTTGTATATATPSQTATPTVTPAASATATPTPTPTPTARPSPTPRVAPTPRPRPTPPPRP